MADRLPSVAYEPPGQPSLFDLWEAGEPTEMLPPLAVRDPRYRSKMIRLLEHHGPTGGSLVSVGAGNGFLEAVLAAAGWDVLATDPASSALRLCRAKGLKTRRYELLKDPPIGPFDVIYCDGVMGHLWDPDCASISTWRALAALGREGSLCCVSNDLTDDDEPQFAVRSSPTAAFYRPGPGAYGQDAVRSGWWSVEEECIYEYSRAGIRRRREIVISRLLTDERIEPEDVPQLEDRE